MRQLVKYSDNILGDHPDYLDDESGIVQGHAERIYFPEHEKRDKDTSAVTTITEIAKAAITSTRAIPF